MGNKRKISEGLSRWNRVRSFIAKENKKQGKKFNGIEINELARSFLDEYRFASFDNASIRTFLEDEVKEFYYSPLDIPFSDLTPVPFFSIDQRIKNVMPKGVNVVVNAGFLGVTSFNTSDYNYYTKDGVRSIVETIKRELYGDSPVPTPTDDNEQFDGFIRRIKGAPVDSKNPNDYFVEWVLFLDGKYMSEVKDTIHPKPTETRKIIPKEVEKAAKKVSKKEREEFKQKRKERKELSKKKEQALKENIELKEKLIKLEEKEIERERRIEELERELLKMKKQIEEIAKPKRKRKK